MGAKVGLVIWGSGNRVWGLEEQIRSKLLLLLLGAGSEVLRVTGLSRLANKET